MNKNSLSINKKIKDTREVGDGKWFLRFLHQHIIEIINFHEYMTR